MKRALLPTKAFARCVKRLAKRRSNVLEDIRDTLRILEGDPFNPALRPHRLKGKLSGSWAATAGYDLRIVYQFVDHEGGEAILLLAAGTHDEVY